MKRVLCVFATLNRGGAENMCMNLYRRINRNEIQFDFVKHTPNAGEFETEINTLGGKIYTAPRYKGVNHLSYISWWYHFLKEHPEYQIIHGHYFTISPVFFSVARRLGRKTIGHVHATTFVGNTGKFIGKLFLSFLPKTTDYRFACSEAAGKWAYGKKDFIVLNNAVDSARFSYDPERRAITRDSLGFNENDKVFVVVANLTEVKNPLGTLDIFSSIRKRIPNAVLLWAGEGTMRPVIEEKMKSNHIEGVTLLGTRSDIPDLLQAADAFMLCSYSEGLPVVTIEAQAAGLPCLLSDVVTREAAITGLCSFLPIERFELWADAAEHALQYQRRDTNEDIIKAGYDINQTAMWLTDFYKKSME